MASSSKKDLTQVYEYLNSVKIDSTRLFIKDESLNLMANRKNDWKKVWDSKKSRGGFLDDATGEAEVA